MRSSVLLALVIVAGACHREPDAGSAPPPSPAPAVAMRVPIQVIPVPVAVPVTAPADAHAVPIAALVTPVPAVTGVGQRRDRSYESLRPYVLGDVPTVEALANVIVGNRVDPGDVPGRFAEACYLAQRGLHAHATLVLRALADAPACPTCVDALANVSGARCGFDAEARALATAPSRLRRAATAVLRALDGGDPAPIARHVDRAVRIVMTCSVCDDPAPVHVRTLPAATAAAYLAKADRLALDGYGYAGPALLFCDARCCSGPIGFLSHSAHTITSICFAGLARAPKLASIHGLAG